MSEAVDSRRISSGSPSSINMPSRASGFRRMSSTSSTTSIQSDHTFGSYLLGNAKQAGKNQSVDKLINFLTFNFQSFDEGRNSILEEFESLTVETLTVNADPDLHRLLKEQGWTGTQFQLSREPPFIDAQSCLNALSNYYLKTKLHTSSQDLAGLAGGVTDIDSHNLDQVLPFCPDILVSYLKKQPISKRPNEPRRVTFTGACMLADISGFSKFSGAMCSKGVSGLDDLREATNGFLGYFVKQVYEYEGDVIAFAGDALICAFRDSPLGTSESCYRALQCAHILRQHKTASLATHIGVTCGEMQIGLLGGHLDQWCYVMNGECVSQLAGCIEDAGPQEVAMTAECYQLACERDHALHHHKEDAAATSSTPHSTRMRVKPEATPTGHYLLLSIGVKRGASTFGPVLQMQHQKLFGGEEKSTRAEHSRSMNELPVPSPHEMPSSVAPFKGMGDVAKKAMTRKRSDLLIVAGKLRKSSSNPKLASLNAIAEEQQQQQQQQEAGSTTGSRQHSRSNSSTETSALGANVEEGIANSDADVEVPSLAPDIVPDPRDFARTQAQRSLLAQDSNPSLDSIPVTQPVEQPTITSAVNNISTEKSSDSALAVAASPNVPSDGATTLPAAVEKEESEAVESGEKNGISNPANNQIPPFLGQNGQQLGNLSSLRIESDYSLGSFRANKDSFRSDISGSPSSASPLPSAGPVTKALRNINRKPISLKMESYHNEASSYDNMGEYPYIAVVDTFSPETSFNYRDGSNYGNSVSSSSRSNSKSNSSISAKSSSKCTTPAGMPVPTRDSNGQTVEANAPGSASSSATLSRRRSGGSRVLAEVDRLNSMTLSQQDIVGINGNMNNPVPVTSAVQQLDANGKTPTPQLDTNALQILTPPANGIDGGGSEERGFGGGAMTPLTGGVPVDLLGVEKKKNSMRLERKNSSAARLRMLTPSLPPPPAAVARLSRMASEASISSDLSLSRGNSITQESINNNVNNVNTKPRATAGEPQSAGNRVGGQGSGSGLPPLHQKSTTPRNLNIAITREADDILHAPAPDRRPDMNKTHSNSSQNSAISSDDELVQLDMTALVAKKIFGLNNNSIGKANSDSADPAAADRDAMNGSNSTPSPLLGRKKKMGWSLMQTKVRRESIKSKERNIKEQQFISVISKFVPRPVLNAIHSESLDLIGELRQVTTLFCSLDTYDVVIHKDPCSLQPFFLMAQKVLHESGGFLRQFLVDDKGCVFIAMWGVPSFTYSNNCSRALFCAGKMREDSEALGHRCSFGIATGTVFCGSVGALERRDYAGVGTDVNMAARLMSKAKERILVDTHTYNNLEIDSQELLEKAEEMTLKGMGAPIAPYMYAREHPLPSIHNADVLTKGRNNLRPRIRKALNTVLDDFLNVAPGERTQDLLDKEFAANFVFLFGLPGTGKSLATQYFRNAARMRNIQTIHVVARSDQMGIPYGMLREIFLELIGKVNFDTIDKKMDVLHTLVAELCEQGGEDYAVEDEDQALEVLCMVLGVEGDELEQISDSLSMRGTIGNNKPGVPIRDYSNGTVHSAAVSELEDGSGKDDSLSQTSQVTQVSQTATRLRASLLLHRDSSGSSRSNLSRFQTIFYDVVKLLLHNVPSVLIIENAHFVDELTWKQLYLMQIGKQLDICVMVTMEEARIPPGRYRSFGMDSVSPSARSGAEALSTSNSSDGGGGAVSGGVNRVGSGDKVIAGAVVSSKATNYWDGELDREGLMHKNSHLAPLTVGVFSQSVDPEDVEGSQFSPVNMPRAFSSVDLNSPSARYARHNGPGGGASVSEKGYLNNTNATSSSFSPPRPNNRQQHHQGEVPHLVPDAMYSTKSEGSPTVVSRSSGMAKQLPNGVVPPALDLSAVKNNNNNNTNDSHNSNHSSGGAARKFSPASAPERGAGPNSLGSVASTSSIEEAIGVSPLLNVARQHPTEYWVTVLDNPATTVVVLGALDREEVRQELERKIVDKNIITRDLVTLVLHVTEGNAYWVNAIASYIQERGAEAFRKAVTDHNSRQNPLKQLVLVHYEALTKDQRALVRHASIIGIEFSEEILLAILPAKLRAGARAGLDDLVLSGFLQSLNPTERTFLFPNQLIQTSLSELTIFGDASHVHRQIGEFIEKNYRANLKPFYPTLGYHFKRSANKRAEAFKYELKASDQQISKGAYNDGLSFLRSASKLANQVNELNLVLEVIQLAIDDIKADAAPKPPSPKRSHRFGQMVDLLSAVGGSGRVNTQASTAETHRTYGFVGRYNQLRREVLRRREDIKKKTSEKIPNEDTGTSSDKKKALLEQAQKSGEVGTLSWTPSYMNAKKQEKASKNGNLGTTSSRGGSVRSSSSSEGRGLEGTGNSSDTIGYVSSGSSGSASSLQSSPRNSSNVHGMNSQDSAQLQGKGNGCSCAIS